MNKFLSIVIIFLLSMNIYAFNGKEELITKLTAVLPAETKIVDLTKTPVANIYKLDLEDMQSVYVSSGGDFLIIGEIFKITDQGFLNVTELERDAERKSIILALDNSELISFPAENELFSVVIFTDIDCGYCRKLHGEISEYLSLIHI